MNTRSIFKTSLSASCTHFGVALGYFYRMREEVFDFELEADFSTPPRELVAGALVSLCYRDGSDFDGIICLAMTDFLDSMIGKPTDADDEMRYAALLETVRDAGTKGEYMKWIKSYYD